MTHGLRDVSESPTIDAGDVFSRDDVRATTAPKLVTSYTSGPVIDYARWPELGPK